jgi:hypothetical protein
MPRMALRFKIFLRFSGNEEVEAHGASTAIGKPSANGKMNRAGGAGKPDSRFPMKFKNGGQNRWNRP